MRKKRKKINWKRTLKNNGYMIGLIMKSCPGVFVLGLISTILGAAHSFLLNTYLFDGQIVESGSHDELMCLNGKYAEIYRVQAKKYKNTI
jgi:ATP-binding cassette subfamily B protein